ncbi:hypothetical protein ABTK40_20535, partial [Acinetobacter baumannii]
MPDLLRQPLKPPAEVNQRLAALSSPRKVHGCIVGQHSTFKKGAFAMDNSPAGQYKGFDIYPLAF